MVQTGHYQLSNTATARVSHSGDSRRLKGHVTVRVLQGLLPIHRARLVPEVVAGVTLAAVAVPESLGYATIAGMPVVTGLYTMLLPLAMFALLGSSRHLVVGADSATAAILAAGLIGWAVPGSPRYAQLAATMALLAGAMLVVARLVRLGFLANFLSRTVLVGFLTGVGVQVAVGQLGAMLGVHVTGSGTVEKLVGVVRALPRLHVTDLVVCAALAAVVLGARRLAKWLPGALLAVVGAILVSATAHLDRHGVAVLGAVPGGLPRLALPSFAPHDLAGLLAVAGSACVVILAQSSATSRAYAARYDETVSEDDDLVGLGAANLMAAFTSTFVVNGSPTKSQIMDSAGGRSQLAQVCSGVTVLLVLLVLTGPLAYLPLAALATVVFLIGVELVDVAGMRRIFRVRKAEFVVAVLTTAAVLFLGVEQGILVAVVASVVDHLRHSYQPRNSVLVKSSAGHWRSEPVAAGTMAADGLVVYRFGAGLYFANASRLVQDVEVISGGTNRVRWLCLDAAAIGDVDFSASVVLSTIATRLRERETRLVLSTVSAPLRHQLDLYGFTAKVGPHAYFDTAGEVFDAARDGSLPDR